MYSIPSAAWRQTVKPRTPSLHDPSRFPAAVPRAINEMRRPSRSYAASGNWRPPTLQSLPVVCQNSVPKTGRWPSGLEQGSAMSLVLALLGALRASLRTRSDLALENLALRQQLVLLRRLSFAKILSQWLDDGPAACEPGRAMSFVLALLGALRASLRTRTDLALENLALRQQLALLRRRSKRPRVGSLDRAFWVWLSRRWAGWRGALHVVRPETVIRWHRQGFRAFWTWKSRRGRVGRSRVISELADLVRTMALANPLWGSPRIHGELLKLGLHVSQRTVSRLLPRRPKPPSQSWRTFLQNHLADLVSVDFFVVPTATFRVLYMFVVLLHHRRRIVHFNGTDSPTAAWTAQQIVEAFPDDSAPRHLLRDRDNIYGCEFRRRVASMGITEVLTAPRSPWQNPFAERVIGTIRRELLDHVIVLNEAHLRRRLRSYLRYYNEARPHQGLRQEQPVPRMPEAKGRVMAVPVLNGLHHDYRRAA
jgi:putative transposase